MRLSKSARMCSNIECNAFRDFALTGRMGQYAFIFATVNGVLGHSTTSNLFRKLIAMVPCPFIPLKPN